MIVGDNYHIIVEEYYATFDFSQEIIGTEPSADEWDASPSSSDGNFSIVDAGTDNIGGAGETGDNYNEIVKISDNSSSASIFMEHNYTDQAYGTVEFWVSTTDTNSMVWVFNLMQTDILGLAIMMDSNEWKYTINGIDYYIIDADSSPDNDTWYHARIDFRSTGAPSYFGLDENKFRVLVDNVSSSQYTFTTLSSINKTRISTGIIDTGVAYLDAIGYSWDPYYNVGDNSNPMIHYQENSLIWFSAFQTTDTPSDIDSLSYYWDLGDGSSDLGKYISHEYVTSGMYPVELTVIDDNGDEASKTKVVLLGNAYPNITITSGNITTYEGITVTFETIVDDGNADIPQMEYFWHLNGSNFDPYDVSQYEQGGWINSYTFDDDHVGKLYAMARDPNGAFDVDSIDVTVLNIDPSVSIRDLGVIADITLEVERSGPPYNDNNFTFVMKGIDKFGLEFPFLYTSLNFTGSEELIVNYQENDAVFSLLRDWKIYANSSTPYTGINCTDPGSPLTTSDVIRGVGGGSYSTGAISPQIVVNVNRTVSGGGGGASQREMPLQPHEFNYIWGTAYGDYGDLEYNDNNYTNIYAEWVSQIGYYLIEVEAEWRPDTGVSSMDYLRWDISWSGVFLPPFYIEVYK